MFLTLWATPRSISTAFEWMMRQRGDFECFHEPLNELYYYGEDRRSQRDAHVEARPGHTFAAFWNEITALAERRNVFVKDFAYSVSHDLDDAKLAVMTHTFLIRDPERVVQGLGHHWPDCTWEEVGFESLHRLFSRVADRDGAAPPVIDAADLTGNPEGTIRAFCAAVGIEFIAEALSWEPGERAEVSWYGEGTGPWHDNLRQSTGIAAQQTSYPPLEDSPRLVEMYKRSLPLYEALAAHRLGAAPPPT
ncbi:sulfotransferase family protein [Candidatus Poriferisodalis sp.]|uniref:sulfotransferase-like domain-containing protein n=1 Tax=Candidatus Poriferisodalis sp. TaxID=3101277 RepID=UPI003B019790